MQVFSVPRVSAWKIRVSTPESDVVGLDLTHELVQVYSFREVLVTGATIEAQ